MSCKKLVLSPIRKREYGRSTPQAVRAIETVEYQADRRQSGLIVASTGTRGYCHLGNRATRQTSHSHASDKIGGHLD